jgi:hypothetical protein
MIKADILCFHENSDRPGILMKYQPARYVAGQAAKIQVRRRRMSLTGYTGLSYIRSKIFNLRSSAVKKLLNIWLAHSLPLTGYSR